LRSYFKDINRILDANINRLKEGLRVCEEIARFILNSRSLTSELKSLRHRVDSLTHRLPRNLKLLKARNSLEDIGRNIHHPNELKRKNYTDIFLANMQRIKESIRVLEEFSKLIDTDIALQFKKIRYSAYELEKKILRKL
jgi:thiamine-phosphate pyrophosphorylase